MNASFILYSTDQLIGEITSALPPGMQQLAGRLETQTGPLLTDDYYWLLVACLTATIALLFSSLLLVLNYPE